MPQFSSDRRCCWDRELDHSPTGSIGAESFCSQGRSPQQALGRSRCACWRSASKVSQGCGRLSPQPLSLACATVLVLPLSTLSSRPSWEGRISTRQSLSSRPPSRAQGRLAQHWRASLLLQQERLSHSHECPELHSPDRRAGGDTAQATYPSRRRQFGSSGTQLRTVESGNPVAAVGNVRGEPGQRSGWHPGSGVRRDGRPQQRLRWCAAHGLRYRRGHRNRGCRGDTGPHRKESGTIGRCSNPCCSRAWVRRCTEAEPGSRVPVRRWCRFSGSDVHHEQQLAGPTRRSHARRGDGCLADGIPQLKDLRGSHRRRLRGHLPPSRWRDRGGHIAHRSDAQPEPSRRLRHGHDLTSPTARWMPHPVVPTPTVHDPPMSAHSSRGPGQRGAHPLTRLSGEDGASRLDFGCAGREWYRIGSGGAS